MSNYGPSGGPYPEQPQDPWHSRRPQEPYDQPADPWSGNDPWGDTPTPTPQTPPGGPSSPGTGYGGGYGQSPPYGQGYDAGYAQPGQGYGADPGYGYPAPEPRHPDDRGYGGDPGYGYAASGYPPPGQPQPGQPPLGHAGSAPTQVGTPVPTWDQPVPVPPRRGLSTGLVALLGVLTLLVCGGVGIGLYLVNRGDDPGTEAATPPAASAAPTSSAQPQAEPQATQGGSAASTDARFATKGACLVNKGTAKKPAMQIAKCGPETYEVLARFDGTKDYNAKCGNGKVPGYQYYYFFDSDLDTLDFVLCLKKR